jgi:hypothetical protein
MLTHDPILDLADATSATRRIGERAVLPEQLIA